MKYLVSTPWWMKQLYPQRLWSVKTAEKIIYLSFDDGPHPHATTFVLDELKKYAAAGTFFCIGENVNRYPEIYRRILDEGHATGNHTQHHLNGWKTGDDEYLRDIAEAREWIHSDLFRPPYGRLRSSQAKKLPGVLGDKAKIVMWDVLSADFDQSVSGEKCLRNVINNAKPGSIIVFHDSEKAWSRLSFVLPRVLEYFSGKEYRFFRL